MRAMGATEIGLREILEYGVLGACLAISLMVNVFLWMELKAARRALTDLYERFVVSREKAIDKYHEFTGAISDALRGARGQS
jgi:hypothetical protein